MGANSSNAPDEEAREENCELAFDFWADEGAKRFNEMMDEGQAYLSTGVPLSKDPEADPEPEQCEYVDPELYDADEESLPPGEMDLIFENCYIV